MTTSVGDELWPLLPEHPVTRYSTFTNLFRRGFGVEEIARRYNLPAVSVRRYLELGKVDDEILTACYNGTVTISQMTMFSWLDDKKVQIELYRQLDPMDRGIERLAVLIRERFSLTLRK